MPAPRLRGAYTIMPTPFHDDGRLDEESLARLTRFLIDKGVDGVTVLGVLGEAPKLSEAEQEAVLRVTVAAADGRIPVYAGASSGGTDLTVERGLRALELGAAGLMVAPIAQGDGAVLAHYRALDEALEAVGSDAPIILHDYPATTGVRMSAELVTRLGDELPHVTTIKLEDPPTGPKIRALLRLAGPGGTADANRLAILGGLGGTYLVEEMASGADGVMTGLSFPELLVDVVRAHLAGSDEDRERERERFFRAGALLRYEFQPGIGLALRKEIYRRRGAIASARVRAPGAQIDDDMRRELDAVLAYVERDAGLA
jgi:4-hydroxy-tetrahydrodipicolinate synthase